MLFLLPIVASATLLAVGWVNRRHPLICLLWLVGAGALQILSHVYSPLWAAGLVLQAALGIYLAIRLKVD